MKKCIFCQIAKKEIPSRVIFEDKDLMVFSDVNPQAKIHWLIIPKKHISSLNAVSQKDKLLLGKIIYRAKILAKKMKMNKKGFRLVLNTGKDSGQEVAHLHLHLLGGEKLGGFGS